MPIVNIIPTPVRVILKHRAQRRKGLYLFYYNYTLYGEEAQDRRLGVGAKALTTYTACNANRMKGTEALMIPGSGQ